MPPARILCIAHDFPVPADNGSSVRVLGVLRLLARMGEVRLVVRPRASTTSREKDEVRAVPLELVLGPPARANPWRGLALWMRALLRRTPPWYVLWHDSAVVELVRRQLPWATHVVALEDFAADYLLHVDIPSTCRVVIDKHKVYADRAATGERRADPWGRLRVTLRQRLVRRHELATFARADAVLVNTDEEAARFREAFGRPPDAVIASGIDVVPWPGRPEGPPHVVWLGTLDNDWNRRGLLRFIDILRELEEQPFRLLIAGRGADDEVNDAAAQIGAEVLGFVEDLAPLLGRCAASVIPVWAGGGGRVKTLLLLGSGLPVVATSMALEGTDARPVTNCAVADDPSGLVSALLGVLADPASAAAMGRRAADLVAQTHSWESREPLLRQVVLYDGSSTRSV